MQIFPVHLQCLPFVSALTRLLQQGPTAVLSNLQLLERAYPSFTCQLKASAASTLGKTLQ